MKKNSKTEAIIFVALSALIWIYLWLRAYYIPLVHDEAATFFHFIHPGDLLPFTAHLDANNHFLNSALAWVCYKSFGSSMLALRLPNLLFALVFFFYSYKISTQINSVVLRWFFIGTLFTASYFIEFFALSRGYGISMALMLGAIWNLILVYRDNKTRNYLATLVLLLFAVSANLTLLNTSIIINAILLLKIVENFRKQKWKNHIIKLLSILVFGVLPFVFFAIFSFKLRDSGSLYYGDNIGFWESTIRTLLKAFTAGNSLFSEIVLVWIFIFSIIVFIVDAFKRKLSETLKDFQIIFPVLLVGNLCAILILSVFFKVNYPEDRVALYLFPLLIGTIVFAFDKLKYRTFKIIGIISLLPLLFFPYQTLKNLNTTHSSFWKSERLPESFFKIVEQESIEEQNKPTIGGYLMRELCWNYWNYRNEGKNNSVQTSDYPGNIADFQISDKNKLNGFLGEYNIIETDAHSELSLLKRKKPLKKTKIASENNISSNGETNTEYFNFYETTDTLTGKRLLLSYDLSVFSKIEAFDAFVVITVFDKDRKTLQYISYSLYRAKTHWNGEKSNLKISLYVPELSKESHSFITYFWNVNKVPFEIKEGKVDVWELY